MFIVRKDGKSIINFDQIETLYIGGDGCSIKVDYKSGKGCQLGTYSSITEAKEVMELIAGSIGKTEVYHMPSDDAIKARMNLKEKRYHHATGKKTKGHGGS